MKRRTFTLFAVLVGVGVVASIAGVWTYNASWARFDAKYRPEVAKLFDGENGLAVIANPTKVEAFRLGPLPDGIDLSDAVHSDFPEISEARQIPPSLTMPVSSALASPRSYGWGYVKACLPRYGIKLSFVRGSDRVDILLCFSCDILWIAYNGETTGGEDFDNMQPVLVRAVKAAFPDDAVVQSLREGRSGSTGL